MLSGFNTNIRHRGTLFHVQTEDSGRKHPHIISHLYYGGTILASQKSGYAELLMGDSSPDQEVEAGVRTRMQNQHKGMLRRLTAGAFDLMIAETLGREIFEDAGSAQADSDAASPAASAQLEAKKKFGDTVLSEKPLDEVVFDFLVENARKKPSSR